MLARYQNGCLQTIIRKDGVERWQFRWLHKGADGISRERKKTIGPIKDYPEDSCTGAAAALNSKDDVGHLHPSPESAEARGAKLKVVGMIRSKLSCTVVVPRV